jgi:hypothetical protein
VELFETRNIRFFGFWSLSRSSQMGLWGLGRKITASEVCEGKLIKIKKILFYLPDDNPYQTEHNYCGKR